MELKRTLNLFDATAIGIGAIIGAGIFVVLGIAIGYAGPAVILSIIMDGVVASFNAFSFAELWVLSSQRKEGYMRIPTRDPFSDHRFPSRLFVAL